jgi:hypothetical protein
LVWSGWHRALQRYDPQANSWLMLASMSQSRDGLQLLPLKAEQCFGGQCVGTEGGAIALGVRVLASNAAASIHCSMMGWILSYVNAPCSLAFVMLKTGADHHSCNAEAVSVIDERHPTSLPLIAGY